MIIQNPTPELVNENIIKVLEEYFDWRLPKSYRKFLLETNGGAPEKIYFCCKQNETLGTVQTFFGIIPEYSQNLLSKNATFRGRIPRNTIAIASDPGGDLILLSNKGEDCGKIYYWDHNWEAEEGEEPTYDNLTLIADSFEEFINNLKSEDEIDLD